VSDINDDSIHPVYSRRHRTGEGGLSSDVVSLPEGGDPQWRGVTHAISLSHVRETILWPGGKEAVIEPGDVVRLEDVDPLQKMLQRQGANPMPFTPFQAELQRGQWLVSEKDGILRGRRLGFDKADPIPPEHLPHAPGKKGKGKKGKGA